MTFPPLPGFLSGDRVPDPDYAMILTAYSATDNTRAVVVGIKDGQLVRLNQALNASADSSGGGTTVTLAISPDGRWMYAGSPSVRWWDVDRLTFKPSTALLSVAGEFVSCSFGSASDLVATIGGHNSPSSPGHAIYRLVNGEWVPELLGNVQDKWRGRSVAIAPDGTLAVFTPNAGGGQKPVWFSYAFNSGAWQLIQQAPQSDEQHNNMVGISPSSHMLCVTKRSPGDIIRYTRSGNLWQTLDVLPSGGSTNGGQPVWAPDQSIFAHAGTSNTSRFYSVDPDGVTFTLLPHPMGSPPVDTYSIAFSPDSNYVAICSGSAPYLSVFSISGTTFTKLPDLEPAISGPGYADVVFHPGYQPA